MSSFINDPLAVKWLNVLKPIPSFASLHFDVPSPQDPGASEVSGGSYSRCAFTWVVPQGQARFLVNQPPLTWLNLDQVTIVAVGVWDAATKGNCLLWTVLSTPIPVASRGSYQVGAAELFVTV